MKKYLIGSLITLAIVLGVTAYSTSKNVHSIVYDAVNKVFNINIRGSNGYQISSGKHEIKTFNTGSVSGVSTTGAWVSRSESYFDLSEGVWRLEGRIKNSYGTGTVTYPDSPLCRWSAEAGDNTTSAPDNLSTLNNVENIFPADDISNDAYNIFYEGSNWPIISHYYCQPAILKVTSGTARVWLAAKITCTNCSDGRILFRGAAMKISD
jgi:hypothetical protein